MKYLFYIVFREGGREGYWEKGGEGERGRGGENERERCIDLNMIIYMKEFYFRNVL